MVAGFRRLIIPALVASAPLRACGARSSPGDDEMFQEVLGLLAEELVAKDAEGHVQSAMQTLSPTAVQAMFDYFVPDAATPPGATARRVASMRRLLQKEVLRAIPELAADKFVRLDPVETVGEMCHWLAVRVSKMPWVDTLRSKTGGELRRMLLEAGAEGFCESRHRNLMARILRLVKVEGKDISKQRSGAPDPGILRHLLEQELRDGPQRVSAPRPASYIDECPTIVREELKAAGCASGAAVALPTPPEGILAALEGLPGAAVRAMYQHFVPDACWPSGQQATVLARMRFRLSRRALATMPPEAVMELPSLGYAEAVGSLCHWLTMRLMRMPCARGLAAMSTKELRQVLEVAGARRFLGLNRRNLVAKILRSASADSVVRSQDRDVDVAMLQRLLDRSVPRNLRTVAVESVGRMEACPEIVQQALVGRQSELESVA